MAVETNRSNNLSLALFAVIVVALLATLVAFRYLSSDDDPLPDNSPANSQTVTIAIDAGDGRPLIEVPVDWQAGMTVVEAMQQARADGSLDFESQGRGEGAFVTHIEGVANGGADGRNWLFDINGEMSQVGVGVYELEPGDRVLWRFAPYE